MENQKESQNEKQKNKLKLKQKKILMDTDNLKSVIQTLSNFEQELKSAKNISILSADNLLFFNSLISKDNIKINILLSRIFSNILSMEYLYKIFLPSIKQNEESKIELIFALIDNCALLIEKLSNFVFSPEIFNLKKKILGLLNSFYNNCKNKFNEDDENLNKIIELMNSLPNKFYSEAFNEMTKSKEIFEIFKSKNPYSINKFETLFSEINNYFEQFEIFKKFVEINSEIKSDKKAQNDIKLDVNQNNQDLIDFYEKYGILLIKFCIYHNYIFLDKDEKDDEKEKSQEFLNEFDDEENNNDDKTRVIFLIDKMIKEKNNKNKKENSEKNKRVETLLKNKRFISTLSSEEYKTLISAEINHFLTAIKNFENHPKLNPIKNHLLYFLEAFDAESYYPLYLKNLTKMVINDNFTESFITNVLPGEKNKFYFETNFNEDIMIYIEFYLEDKTKDINFELNKYDNATNSFKAIFKEERLDDTTRFFISSHGYSIYELVFDNEYSWFNSKDVNFRVSYLRPLPKEKDDEIYDNDTYFLVNDDKYYYNKKENFGKDLNIKNVPVILYRNNLKTINLDNEEIVVKENKEDENIISELYFNYVLSSHLKKSKIDKKEEILVSILSQNCYLPDINKDLKEKIENCPNKINKKFIHHIGFCPNQKRDDFNINYKLYSLDELLVINHKILMHNANKEKEIKEHNKIENNNNINEIKEEDKNKEIKIKHKLKPILLIYLDKNSANTILFNKAEFHNEIKKDSKEIILGSININKDEEILNIIKNINDNLKEIEVVSSFDVNLDEENKKRIKDLLEKIKDCCLKGINPSIPFYEYDINDICNNLIKYICL